jgi:hypothetical protein
MLIQECFVRQHDLHILRFPCELQPLLIKLNLSKCLGLLELPFDRRLLLLQLDLLPLNSQLLLRALPASIHPLLLRIQHEFVPLLFLVFSRRKNARPCGGHFCSRSVTGGPCLLPLVSHDLLVILWHGALQFSTTISSSSSSNPIDWCELEPSFLFLLALRSATSCVHFGTPFNMIQQWLKANGFFSVL